MGAGGSALVAVASDLPGSPYGPHAAGLWPFESGAPAPAWEGPRVPAWMGVADQAAGVKPGHVVVVLAAVSGIAILLIAWALLWRQARTDQRLRLRLRQVCWLGAAWTAPLLFAAPFGSQDVWLYGAQGRLVLRGTAGYSPPSLLGHSSWLAGVDPQWAVHPSLYGPVALDLSALFAAAGRPWLAAECWRATAIIGLGLCAWGVNRIVSLRPGKATAAVVAGVVNPAMLVVLVGGIHNDALMLGLAVAGLALAVSGSPLQGALLCALAVGVKPVTLLVVGALAWWAWGGSWRGRARGALIGAVATVGTLALAGLGTGGGFGWLKSFFSYGAIPGPFSLGMRFFGASSGSLVDAIELLGIALAVALLVAGKRPAMPVSSIGWGFVAVALTTTKPEPWYLAWGISFLVCEGLQSRSERAGVLLLSTMMTGSTVALGVVWWFGGAVLLAWLGIASFLPGSPGDLQPNKGAAATPPLQEQLDGL